MNVPLILSVAVGTAVGLFFLLMPSAIELLNRIGDRRRRYYSASLDELQEFEENPAYYFFLEIASMFVVGAVIHVIFGAVVLTLIGAVAGYLVPSVLIRRRVRVRHEKFDLQLPDALTSVASSVRAGLSLPQAIEEVAENLPNPIAQEFALIVRQYKTGLPLDEVLRTVQKRVNSRHFNLVCNALIINRERGGDVVHILERIEASLRELYRLEEKIRTETAGPRFEAQAMMFVPPVILLMFSIVQPELVSQLFRTPIGIVMVLFAAALMFVSFYWIQKIINEDV